jgi:surfactin synthase thioesterase subunit
MNGNPNANLWVHCPKPKPQARLRLFCFPYAGGGIGVYRFWPNYLPGDVELCAIQLPGRDSRLRETPFVDLPLLINALMEGLAPKLTTPYAFFGHSLGAVIAFELARKLLPTAMSPVHLFLSARRAPHVPSRYSPCHQLPDDEFIETIVRRYNGIPPAVLAEPELMKLFVPVLRADFTLLETYEYVPQPPIDLPLTVFAGTDDQVVSTSEVAAWREMTRSAYDFRIVPGGHFFLQTAQVQILETISQQLVKV